MWFYKEYYKQLPSHYSHIEYYLLFSELNDKILSKAFSFVEYYLQSLISISF